MSGGFSNFNLMCALLRSHMFMFACRILREFPIILIVDLNHAMKLKIT